MNAEIKPRIDLKNRTRLETVIPLRTPFIINIDPCDTCNFQCKFCPTGDRALLRKNKKRGHGLLDFDLYKRIIDTICDFEDKVKVIRLYKDGEPLLNPHFADMVKYARDSGCCERIDTTTNASLLTPELSQKIIDAGLTRVNISVEGMNENQYFDFSHYRIDFKCFVENIRYFYNHRKQCEMIVKINGDILSDAEKNQFYEVFGKISDGVFIESVAGCWPTFELSKIQINETRGLYGQAIKEVMVCPYIFYSLFINSDGTYSLCSVDWARELLLGDVFHATPKETWEGNELLEWQKMFLRGERKKHFFCGKCQQLMHGQPDDIDSYAAELLKKIDKE